MMIVPADKSGKKTMLGVRTIKWRQEDVRVDEKG